MLHRISFRLAWLQFALAVLLVLTAVLPTIAQSISGTINNYTKVNTVAGATVTVASAASFNVGDVVLIIQMQGASINTTSGANFGNLTNANCAGCFEYGIISSITGNDVTLQAALTNAYSTNDAVQMISVPVYPGPTITSNLTCPDWDGETGGVIALNACSTVVMNADIDAEASGFRGGTYCTSSFSCASVNWAVSFNSTNSCNGGQKGESIASTTVAQSGGMAKRANGGGGSIPGNSGAGGGGNYGAGGQGGNQYSGCAPGNNGQGGIAIPYTTTRAIMGGGGGGGYRDNGQTVTDGGNGGGIVLISAPEIQGNGNTIRANGEAITVNTNDEGSGAGGAGGSVFLDVDAIIDTLNVDVDGGKGGDTYNNIFQSACHGPGGGGGGGVMWYKGATTPANLVFSGNGGASGIVGNPLSSCFNTTFAAAAGGAGAIQNNLSINTASSGSAITLSLTPGDTTICFGGCATITAGGAPFFQWSPAAGLDTTQGPVVNACPDTTTTYTLTAISCSDTIDTTFTITVLPVPVVQIVGLDSQYCEGDPPAALATTPVGGSFIGPVESGALFIADSAGLGSHSITYQYTAANNCVVEVIETTVVYAIPNVTILNLDTSYCIDDNPVTLTGSPGSGVFSGPGVSGNDFTPSAAGSGDKEISYSFTDSNACTGSVVDTTYVSPLPVLNFTGLPSISCIDDSAYELTPTPTGGTFTGMGMNGNEFEPPLAGVATHQITYSFTNNFGCSSDIQEEVEVKPLPTPDIVGLDPTYCENNPTGEVFPTPTGGVLAGPGVSGTWFDPTVAGRGTHVISYTYTDEFGCIGIDLHSVVIFPKPNVTFGGLADTYCPDDEVSLLTGLPAGGIYSGNGMIGTNFNPGNAGTGTHVITYTYADSLGCEESRERETVVHPSPEILFNPNDSIYCLDQDAVELQVSPRGGTWVGPGMENNQFVPEKVGVGPLAVSYRYVDGNGCFASRRKGLLVRPLPEVSLDEPDDPLCLTDPVFLNGSPTGGSFEGAGVLGETYDPVESGAGLHVLSYTYTDDFGCVNTAQQLYPGACQGIYIPTAFTPNGDQVNDEFKVQGENITYFRMHIFTRWGEKVFSSSDPTVGWDGRMDGQLVQAGEYIYAIEYKLGFEVPQQLRGSVFVLRGAKQL